MYSIFYYYVIKLIYVFRKKNWFLKFFNIKYHASKLLPMNNNIKFYIVINSDLKLSKGHISAQVSHITHTIIDEIVRIGYEEPIIPNTYTQYIKWCKNPITIIKKTSELELYELQKLEFAKSYSDNIPNHNNNVLTSVGFFPGCVDESIMNKFKLL